MKKNLLLIFFFFSGRIILSQTNVCGIAATLLNVNSNCTYVSGSTASATGGATGCALGTNDDDVWYRFVATSSTAIVTVDGATNFDAVISCWTSCSAITAVTGGTCIDITANDGIEQMSLSGLIAGSTYYIQVYDYSTGTGSFSICVSSGASTPVNDDPISAISISPEASCSYTTYSNLGATNTTCGVISTPGCASYLGGDVWFSIVVPSSGGFNIDMQVGSVTDAGIAIYSGTPCGTLNLITCDDNSSVNGLMPYLQIINQTPGSTLFIRVWEYGNNSNGTFGLCVTNLPPAPINNECAGATPIVSGTSCVAVAGTTSWATESLPGCLGNANDDVWYQFTPSTEGQTITITASSSFDPVVEVFTGGCATLNSVGCNDADYQTGGTYFHNFVGLTPGQVCYLRVYAQGLGVPVSPTFSVCAQNFTPLPPDAHDCLGAIPVCSDTYFMTSITPGVGNVPDEINSSNTCFLSGEKNDTWFKFTVQSAGNLCFVINPTNNTDDFDWLLYDLTNNDCSDLFANPGGVLDVACNYSSSTAYNASVSQHPIWAGIRENGNTGMVPTPNVSDAQMDSCILVSAGQNFVLNVSQYSFSTAGYTLHLPPTGTPGMATIFDVGQPIIASLDSIPSCGSNAFSFNFSEFIECASLIASDFTFSGPGGPYNVNSVTGDACILGGQYENKFNVVISPAIQSAGTYSLCLVSSSGSVTDVCGNVSLGADTCFVFTIPEPMLTTISTNPLCAEGSISASATGGSGAPYLFSLNNGTYQSSGDFNQLVSGTYTITVKDSKGCSISDTEIITAPSSLSLSLTASNSGCTASGTITSNVSGGTPSYTYVWYPSGVGSNLIGLSPNTYTLVLTDANGCSTTEVATISSAIAYTQSVTICFGDSVEVGSNFYSIAGTYIDLLLNINGCDSVVTTNLLVSSPISTFQNITICEGASIFVGSNEYELPGVYIDTLASINGCDSIVTTNLVVSIAISTLQNVVICEGDSIFVGSSEYELAGVYIDTLVTLNGCDSVVTTNLTVNLLNSVLQNVVLCNGESVQVGNSNYFNSGIYVDTLVSINGCDSIITTNLVVNQIDSIIQNVVLCNGQSIQVGSNNYINTGTYTDTFTALNGCDSIVITNLFVNPIYSILQNHSLCFGQSITVGSNTYSTSGNYVDSLYTISGCDSIIATNLIVDSAISFTQNITLCQGQSLSVGSNTYSAPGTYVDVLTSVDGCDSLVTSNVAFEIPVDVSVSVSGLTITADFSGANYQWIDCGNSNVAIVGENNQSFIATNNGDYAVVVEVNSCSDTSTCVNINSVAISNLLIENAGFVIYPNPNDGVFVVKSKLSSKFNIVNELGEVVRLIELNQANRNEVKIEGLSTGIYFIVGRNNLIREKIVVTR